ncbi:MAG: DMT family transporter [Deltaproteobacteria bacterium]|nr:MAG: DMT family transporter [Deltaproteobacteria bacterium]
MVPSGTYAGGANDGSRRRGERVSGGLALALIAAALWGFGPVATKAALAGYSPELISVVRLGLAAVLFRALAGRGTRWLPREPWTCIAGVALGADFILYNYGLRRTTAALAGLVINVGLVSTILLAFWILDERLTRRRMLGAAITLAGVAYVAGEGIRLGDLVARERIVGNVLVMLAGTSWSLCAIAQRRAPRERNLFRLLTPIFAVAFAHLVLAEPVTARVVTGGLVIVAGVLVIVTERALPTVPAGAPD